jgi:hypothetical protein
MLVIAYEAMQGSLNMKKFPISFQMSDIIMGTSHCVEAGMGALEQMEMSDNCA